ncbi:hypothetical protein SAMN05421679_102113 [Epilithonimonas pallida]|uniref:Endonuclease/Exonuclease/phosphatase family protein n=1 Tax=Epilithonimonas pallida TaxID=373671 RepID=A0ABY1QYU1_9FLAO|nr:hypothetical protein SAMN05421679_102113 [Epilithonimonas pallida]
MKIATLNIDWCKKFKSEKVEMFLSQQDFDFLILTEAVNLNLSQFPFKYFSEQIPENTEYEGLNYSKYLSGEKAYRTIIYSKVPSTRIFSVIDNKTSWPWNSKQNSEIWLFTQPLSELNLKENLLRKTNWKIALMIAIEFRKSIPKF